MKDDKSELAFLEKLTESYTVENSSQTQVMRELAVKTFRPYITGGRLLELGCSDGFMTNELSKLADHLDVIDGSEHFLSLARKRNIKNVDYYFELFENFKSNTRYDHIVASYVLEHVRDPISILNNCSSLLAPGGKIYIVVPNSRALSRQLGRHMGLISELTELTENDHNHGHRRVYDRRSLNMDITRAGLTQVHQGGLMLKLLADFQMDELIDSGMLSKAHILGLYELGLEYPDFAGSLFSICANSNHSE